MSFNHTKRPRNVTALRAAAILYGDWGTSKAYVIGLAFALGGYSSFWTILAVSVVTALVGLNYIIICKNYPNGGGVYASVRHRSQVLSLVGALFLFADYLVTAALSALSAFHYFAVPYPEIFAAAAILFIGTLNYFGPKHTGSLAILLAIPTFLTVIFLGIISIPHLPEAVDALQPLPDTPKLNWEHFVGVILALSGIESIANITGVMKLDPHTTISKPSVIKTATPAIVWTMVEVCFFTALFGLAIQALPGLSLQDGNVNAPGAPHIRDDMLRYMGETFGGSLFGQTTGHFIGMIVGGVFCILLLSAVNTAIVSLVSLQFILSRDHELPSSFQRLNSFGVPVFPLIVATLIPIFLILLIGDVAGLADLYAIGCVGAIATNLVSTATDKKLEVTKWQRSFMLFTFLVMALIEVSLFFDKPKARFFVMTIIACGLILRGLVKEQRNRKRAHKTPVSLDHEPAQAKESISTISPKGAILCATTHPGRTLDFALEESSKENRPLYLLFIRVQKVISEEDHHRSWKNDPEATKIFEYVQGKALPDLFHFCYTISDSPADTIIESIKTLEISELFVGPSRYSPLINMVRGNLLREVELAIPSHVKMVVVT